LLLIWLGKAMSQYIPYYTYISESLLKNSPGFIYMVYYRNLWAHSNHRQRWKKGHGCV